MSSRRGMIADEPLAYIMAGGEGSRLRPLTNERAKPAVPIVSGRVIDFPLVNAVNSKVLNIQVVLQYLPYILSSHMTRGWDSHFGHGEGRVLKHLFPVQGHDRGWYTGTADAIYQNLRAVHEDGPTLVDILAGDHLYFMDLRQMHRDHRLGEADLTIAGLPVLRSEAGGKYGILVVDSDGCVLDFEEKPADPKPIPGNEDYAFISLGIYTFNPEVLVRFLEADARKIMPMEDGKVDRESIMESPDTRSSHDFGFDIIPAMKRAGMNIRVHDFMTNEVPGASESERGYWRDIGDLISYYTANMEIGRPVPPINLYNRRWRFNTHIEDPVAAKVIGGGLRDSMLSHGCILSHSEITDSALSYDVRVDRSSVDRSLLLGGNNVLQGSEIRYAIIDRDIRVPEGTRIGVDKQLDLDRYEREKAAAEAESRLPMIEIVDLPANPVDFPEGQYLVVIGKNYEFGK